ncbi:hypothetical protein [Abiotrophia defectiva]|uniref:hypothetical protein n=1 Tax=Abiotrophia defectiva TaxID=46125 RepID=UPI0026ED22F2|nr:hypothetical protein [Abiotrophia defectiva]
MSELIVVVALLIALVSWIGLGVILYKEHLEERERVTEEWRRRNAKAIAEDWRAIGKDMEKAIEGVTNSINAIVGKEDNHE